MSKEIKSAFEKSIEAHERIRKYALIVISVIVAGFILRKIFRGQKNGKEKEE